MQRSNSIGVRAAARLLLHCSLVLSVVNLAFPRNVFANPSTKIIRVEEDWELCVDAPVEKDATPQVICTFSPNGKVDWLHATVELNHQSLPTFVPGGVQLQLWDGERPLSSHRFPDSALMATPGETVRWTQAIELGDGKLTFEVVNGSSTTWGTFGGQGYLKTVVAATLPDLNSYTPAVSTNHSGISYASNRVKLLLLKEVRLFAADGTVYTKELGHVLWPRD